jgi:hypothetical protein
MQSGICEKCQKRAKCKKPCRPVELHLREDNLTAFQKNGIGKHGEEIRIAMPRSREDQRSSLSTGHNKNGDPRTSTKDAQAFSTENENSFMHYEPNFKQTSVFLQRFFGKWSYEDIAQANDLITPHAAMALYHAAAKRLLAVIMEMDAVRKAMSPKERKKAAVAKQKRYLEKNREKVNARRRAHYQKNKERINAKRRGQYS